MADTLQSVVWSLEQACLLRVDDAVTNPGKAIGAIAQPKMCADSLDRPRARDSYGVFGDVCVTGTTSSTELPLYLKQRLGSRVSYPYSGFLISKTFERVGGPSGLRAMCARCPANTTAPRPAGCANSFYLWPSDSRLEMCLRRIVARLGIEAEVHDAFLPTTPMWYGFWARSPLSPRAARPLAVVMRALANELPPASGDDEWQQSQLTKLREFVLAAEICATRRLPLHVLMGPPGHTDFGIWTTFPHCPACKAEADLEPWKRRYPTEECACKVCGSM